MNRSFLPGCALLLALAAALAGAEPKKLLVVSTTLGPRDASIPNGEKMLRELAAKSNGQFSLVVMSDAPDYPFSKVPTPVLPPAAAARGPVPGFAGTVTAANPAQQAALTAAGAPLAALATAATTARTELTAAALTAPATIAAKAEALGAAEANLALARAAAFAQLQASANRLSAEQIQSLAAIPVARGGAAGRGAAPAGPTAPDHGPVVAKLFQQYLSPAALRNYDGIILLNATGNLPFPDRDAFLKWVSDGHAVVALHAAMNTGYEMPEAYRVMLSGGSRYASSPGGSAMARKIYRVDATHPATKDWPDGLAVVDEFFQFNRQDPRDDSLSLPGLDRTKVHSLLDMDYDGQHLAVAWTKLHGRGRVFYTSLGHRDDVMLPGTPAMDGNAKLNPDAVSAAYQAHVLNGIRWALGLVDGNNATGNVR
jgi:type 1 glutamine amidotransferase